MKHSLTSSFGGHVGRLYRFRLASWKTCPRLLMARSVEELPIDPEVDVMTKTAVSSLVKPVSVRRVPFDPHHLKKVGVRNAALFGREVDKWAGETDVEFSKTTNSSDAAPHEMVDNELDAKHDRVLNALKQEEWKHRNVNRQDYWDKNLDTGKVKKVRKRKKFVPNEGRKNVFQTTLLRKKNDAKRQRTV
ncbi:unnamed protein product [Peronospora destructor]|nr:unnamed protein product [Peronospora destructor]